MGNCLTSNKVQAQNDDQHDDQQPEVSFRPEVIEQTGKVKVSCSMSEEPKIDADGVLEKKSKKKKKKKMVRFKLNEENNNNVDRRRQGESKNGVVRIRLVVTQKELQQILSSRADHDLKQNSSMEQLIRVMKLRGIRISSEAAGRIASNDHHDHHHDGFHGGWRPALESIPEEQ